MTKRFALIILVGLGALVLPTAAVASDLYTGDQSSDLVRPFSIASDGSLNPITCTPSPLNCATSPPTGVAMTPDGKLLYSANGSPGSIMPFSVDPATGALTAETATTGPSGPFGIAVSPNGQFVYTTHGNEVAPFSIGSGGSLTAITCTGSNCTAGNGAQGIAITPNGQFLYTANIDADTLSEFSIGSGGSLSQLCSASCPNTGASSSPRGIAVTPNGKFLYVAEASAGKISVFAIGSSGSLTAVTCARCTPGMSPIGIAITADGQHLYTADQGGSDVSEFAINSNGTLTPVGAGSIAVTSGSPIAVTASPSGKLLYADSSDGAIYPFSIDPASGALTPITCPNCEPGNYQPDFQSIVVSPDQAPTAAFTATPAMPGSPTTFSGSGSTASSGQTVARYDWSFGDGQTATNDGPAPTHAYAAPGTYTVTLTVTDDAGCSMAQTYTGQTVSCNGGPSAQLQKQVVVPPTQLAIASQAKVSARGLAAIRIACSGASGATCSGRLSLWLTAFKHVKVHGHSKRRRVTIVIASAPYNLAAGQSETVHVKLSHTGRDDLLSAHKLTLNVTAVANATHGPSAQTNVRLTGTRPKHHKKRH